MAVHLLKKHTKHNCNMKKVTIGTEELRPALKRLSQAVPEKPVIPAHSSFLCKVTEHEVELITSDLELTISIRLKAETVGHPFELLIPFAFFNAVVKLSGSQPLVLEHPSKKTARILADGDVYQLKSLEDPASFPERPELPKKKHLHLDAVVLDKIRDSMLTASKDELRPSMTKTCLNLLDGMLEIASTDAHMLYRYQVPKEVPEKDQLLVSTRMAKAMDGMESADVFWHKSTIVFQSGSITLCTTRHEDKYPDYRVVIPDHPANLAVKRTDLVLAYEKAVLANGKISSLELKRSPSAVYVTSKDIEQERAADILVIGSYEGNAENVGFDPKKMLTMLNQIDYDMIRLHIDTPTRAVLITSEEDENYLGLIMPYSQS